MTDLIERGDAERVLTDSRFAVPEADAAATRPMGRFRASSSRFTNGPAHDRRRRRLETLLHTIDTSALAADASSRARWSAASGVDAAEIARHVPVACLAGALGIAAPDDAPRLVADVAASYASGAESDRADAAIDRLLAAAAPATGDGDGESGGAGSDEDAVLLVQLLVQAYAATAALVEGAIRSTGAVAASITTAELLADTLRDDPPVRLTRRVAPDGEMLTLRLDGPDRESGAGRPLRTLAFGAGARACPAPDLALAMAAAIIEELRA
ncbi:hypothetical protein [Agromyces sp. Soil535]|uniref:hypothetical protein n=1 Tax=Agromyces sp. Soil535 TaxID=1736390 RepID=UPI000700F2CC|nr:hypothetical protein [Agromyces sp. Soil535]KRE30796.1 hypothetical protein ASG80_16160 [Agromyces sp. Soil535]